MWRHRQTLKPIITVIDPHATVKPSEVCSPSEYCNQREFAHPQVASQQKSVAVGPGEFPPYLESLTLRYQWCLMIQPPK